MELTSPLQGTVVHALAVGAAVRAGGAVVVVEAMKMEHAVEAPVEGTVASIAVRVGDPVSVGATLAVLAPGSPVHDESSAPTVGASALDEVLGRRAAMAAGRADSVERRHARGGRTARENVEDLLDEGSLVELGGLAVAAQRGRRSMAELVDRTPADGVLTGFGRVGGRPVAVAAYDYTVLAGTQGTVGHWKLDRLFELVERQRVPVVLFAEGGGGRPGDTDHLVVSALHTRAFVLWARLSGLVPRIAVVSGSCFAGNAALAGSSDLVVATEGSSWGMGGPAMIEGGGLGAVAAGEVGPLDVQVAAGSVDVAVPDEAAAVVVVQRLLSLLSGELVAGAAEDQAELRTVVPADRRRAYDVAEVVRLLCDTGSVAELRPSFAPSMTTVLARLDGRPVGVLANNPLHGAGAITSDGADKAARFLQLCDAYDVPVLSLVDTPGMMVGPEAEATGLVRHSSRLFVVGASLSIPVVAVVLRKAVGLGAQAMLAGGTHEPLLTLAWPTGELAPMGLEGAVKLGFRREIEALPDAEREAGIAAMVELAQAHTSALNAASVFDIDDVVDPADTRALLSAVLSASPPRPPREGRKRMVDTW